jgi:hypothetical protein
MHQWWLYTNSPKRLDAAIGLGAAKSVQFRWSVSMKVCIFLLYLVTICRLLKQQSIQGFVQTSTKSPAIPLINKAGIQEHLLAIITTCDLVRLYIYSIYILISMIETFFSPFALLNGLLCAVLSPT